MFQKPERLGSLAHCVRIGFRCLLDHEDEPATIREIENAFAETRQVVIVADRGLLIPIATVFFAS